MIRHAWLRPLVWWVYSAVAVTGVFATIYMAVQQDYRQSANDPQIAMAEDAAARLAAGDMPTAVVPQNAPLSIESSRSPWITVYNEQGNALVTSGLLHNAFPQPPQSLFDYSHWVAHKLWHALTGQETRVTWQPEPDVRQAIVLVHYTSPQGSGFVAVGRSLSLTEERIIQLGRNLLLAWAFTLGCLLVVSFVMDWILRKN